jgi:hypothetical protein
MNDDYIVFVLLNDPAYNMLEKLYTTRFISADDIHREINQSICNYLLAMKLVRRSFKHRGLFVNSFYSLTWDGKLIFEAAKIVKTSGNINI